MSAARVLEITPVVRAVSTASAALGESPVWDVRSGAVYWVDIDGHRLLRTEVSSGQTVTWQFDTEVCSLALSFDARLVLALRDGVYWFDPASGLHTLLACPEPGRPDNRLNDGKCGPDGAFWVGSMHDCDPKQALGALYRVFPDGSSERLGVPVKVSNGLGFSPDGRSAYHSDSRAARVVRYAIDPDSGSVGPAQPFISMAPEWGRPDGAAVDAQGGYWSCGVGAGRINHFSADGNLLEVYLLPVSHPTMCCFGGTQMRTLFVTSAAQADGVSDTPLAGKLIAFDVALAGLPVHRFGAF